MNFTPFILAGVLGVVFYLLQNRQVWSTSENGLPFDNYFKQATAQYNLPESLLSRIALQESSYNLNASGASGEVGIMQITPRWHPGVNAADPIASIFYAGSIMRKYFNEFGSWEKALAAYNWGETNVRNKGIEQAPGSTKRYIENILQDIGL